MLFLLLVMLLSLLSVVVVVFLLFCCLVGVVGDVTVLDAASVVTMYVVTAVSFDVFFFLAFV